MDRWSLPKHLGLGAPALGLPSALCAAGKPQPVTRLAALHGGFMKAATWKGDER